MADVERYAQEVLEISKKIKDLAEDVRKIGNGSSVWAVGQTIESFLSIFNRFCPFEIDDSVELTKAPPIEEGSGWWSCRHFLVPGAQGKITDRGYSKGKFTFHVSFEEESYIMPDGKRVSCPHEHRFLFPETMLRKAK